jgi:hypothetical protein
MLPWAQPTRQLAMVLRLNFGSPRRSEETPAPSPGRTTTSVEVPRILGARPPPHGSNAREAAFCSRIGACLPSDSACGNIELRRPVRFHEVSQVAPCQPNDWR